MGLFGKTETPEEQIKKWRTALRAEDRHIDRQIRDIQLEQNKVKQAIKAAAKRGDVTNCKVQLEESSKVCLETLAPLNHPMQTLAKELTHSRKAVDRMYVSKATLNSVVLQLQNQLAMAKVAGAMKKSADIMKLMSKLTKLPEMQKTMMELQREMMKAGVIEDMIDDALDNDEDELEEETEAEVERVLFEVTDGVMGAAPQVPTKNVKGKAPAVAEDDGNAEMNSMQARLAALSDD